MIREILRMGVALQLKPESHDGTGSLGLGKTSESARNQIGCLSRSGLIQVDYEASIVL